MRPRRSAATTAELSTLIAKPRAATAAGGNPPLPIAIDQEGGAVRALPHGPPGLSPQAMGQAGSASTAAAGYKELVRAAAVGSLPVSALRDAAARIAQATVAI